jgi:hypothetical protein
MNPPFITEKLFYSLKGRVKTRFTERAGSGFEGGAMKQTLLFFLLGVLLVAFSGCNTIKGAAKGFTQDWDEAKKVDDWLQKHAW